MWTHARWPLPRPDPGHWVPGAIAPRGIGEEARWRRTAARLWTSVLDILLPPACVTCDSRVDHPGLLCGACFGTLSFITAPCCGICGVPFTLIADAAEGGVCLDCAEAPPPFAHARAALNYDQAARRLILPFKHGGRTELAGLLARLMAGTGAALARDADILVPVPLHRRRLFQRRYNQAALLTRELGRQFRRPTLLDGLIRVSSTESLGHKSAAERRDEVAGAFAVRPGREAALHGRRVLLIDDVMTSGATVSACAEALLAGGVASVDVLVAVRVPDPRLIRPPSRRRRVLSSKRRHSVIMGSSSRQ